MDEYFKSWRRKLGVVTLVTACVVMAGWVRSEIVSESVVLPVTAEEAISIVSSHGRFAVEIEMVQTPNEPIWSTFPVSKIRSAFKGKENQWPSLRTFYKLYEAPVPYWVIVIPLIAISSWLLFSKPCISARGVARFLCVYFQPLRRKLGGATLLVACVFIGVGGYSQFHEHRFLIPADSNLRYGVVSFHEGVCFSRFKITNIRGFPFPVEDVVLLVIPHWSIVLPLAVIAAYLLLSNLRGSSVLSRQPTEA